MYDPINTQLIMDVKLVLSWAINNAHGRSAVHVFIEFLHYRSQAKVVCIIIKHVYLKQCWS